MNGRHRRTQPQATDDGRGDLVAEAQHPKRPTNVTPERSRFDRLAEAASNVVSRGLFFTFSLIAIVCWLVAGFFVDFSTRWLEGGAASEGVVTFALVALLENSQRRSDKSIQGKLNALAAALAEQMAHTEVDDAHVDELRAAVGLERRTSV